MNKIEQARSTLRSVKPRSRRRIVLERDLVRLVVKQLKLENRKERSRSSAGLTN